MKISTKGRYALRLMIDLSRHDAVQVSIRLKGVSDRQNISIKYLEQIVRKLVRAKLLVSCRGVHGGYRLAKKPEEYTVAEILTAAEGDISIIACLTGRQNTCPMKDRCLTLPFWQGLNDLVENYLSTSTLADIAGLCPQYTTSNKDEE